jgi:hypothetical protein
MASAIRIRMYRPGFGDCFLLTFGIGADPHHVLVDFGAHMHGEIGTMDQIMADIEKETKKELAVVVATHAHRDHISGFGKFAARFSNFKIEQVWLPWTDNPKDPDAATFTKKQLALYNQLETHLRLALGATEADPRYTLALDALSNLRGNETATSELARGFGTGAVVRYLEAGKFIPKVASIAGLSAEIQCPSRDKSFLTRMDPPADQHFLTAPGVTTGGIHPFPKLEIRTVEADYAAIVKEGQPVLDQKELDELHQLAEAPAGRLALALDSVRNNTSLVIVFRFQGRTLLFPGDAQWGNWQSWIGTDAAKQLLSEVDFLKVAHHGSENATPVDVVNALKSAGLAAMVPTQIKPFPTIPRKPLLAALEKHCQGHVAIRSDWIDVQDAPAGPTPKPAFPVGFKPSNAGDVWIDYEF